jgi:hypothetical protein
MFDTGGCGISETDDQQEWTFSGYFWNLVSLLMFSFTRSVLGTRRTRHLFGADVKTNLVA